MQSSVEAAPSGSATHADGGVLATRATTTTTSAAPPPADGKREGANVENAATEGDGGAPKKSDGGGGGAVVSDDAKKEGDAAKKKDDDVEEEGVYDGFVVDTNFAVDFAVPSNVSEGAVLLVKVIYALVKAYKNKNKMLEAMQTRLDTIEMALNSLKQRDANTLQAGMKALRVLINILGEYKKFVEHLIKKPEGFLQQAIAFFKSQPDLETLVDFDKRITRALDDLQIPLQADQLRLMENQIALITTMQQGVDAILVKIEALKISILPGAELALKEPRAFAFWCDYYPTAFDAPLEDFAKRFHYWLRCNDKRGVTLREDCRSRERCQC